MTRSVAIRVSVLGAIVAVWLLPFIRAIRLLTHAKAAFAEQQSVNAWNDYIFSQELLASYGFSLSIAVALAWGLCRSRNWLLLLPLAASLLVALNVLHLNPENLIGLIPPMQPFRPAAFSAVIGLAALLMSRLYPSPQSDPQDVVP